MRIVELIIDEQDDQSGIDAISVVMSPAIESNFIHLSKHEVLLKEIDAEKKILMGPALIPDKQIYRRNDKTKDEYYIYFSKATIRKASELFLMNANQNNSTLEHSQKLKGMSVVESWIIEGQNDKSKNYGFDLPKGTWMISMKVNNDEIWNKVKLGEVKGFSIEGYFADRYEMNSKNIDMEEKAMVEKIKELIIKSELKSNKVNLGLVDDLTKLIQRNTTPTDNAKRLIDNVSALFKVLNGIKDEIDSMKIQLSNIEGAKANLGGSSQDINKIILQVETQVKQLGLDVKEIKGYSTALEIIKVNNALTKELDFSKKVAEKILAELK
jgi:hypothetical protein